MTPLNHKVRLAFFTEMPIFGGGEQVLVTLLNTLPPERFALTCICTDADTQQAISDRVAAGRVDFAHFDQSEGSSIWRTVWPLSRLFRRLRPHILHCNSLDAYGGSYAVLAGRLARVPLVLGTFHMAKPYPEFNMWENLFRFTVDRSLHSAIAVSQSTRTQILRHRLIAPDRITVIHNGVEIPPAAPLEQASHPAAGSRDAQINIGTVARLVPSKDIATFLRASALLLEHTDRTRFTIIGDGPERSKLVALAHELGVSEWVAFVGWQDPISPALLDLDLFVLTSLSEACPLTVLEAMAHRLPVIATEVGGVPEIVTDGKTGILVDAGDPESLASALGILVADAARREALGRAARLRAEGLFSAEKMTAQTEALYLKLLSGGSSSLRRLLGYRSA